jgi:hypothetical protein
MKGIGWSSLIAGLIILVPGVVGLLTGRLALFASLGLAALMHAYLPEHPSSRFYNVVVSHLGGLISAFVAVAVVSDCVCTFYLRYAVLIRSAGGRGGACASTAHGDLRFF